MESRSNKFLGISLPDDDVKKILSVINDSNKDCEYDIHKRGFDINNRKPFDRWDFLFHAMKNTFNDESYITICFKRSSLWSFAVIYNKSNKIVYFITKYKNFKKVRNDKNSSRHYFRSFSSINDNIEYRYDEQLSMGSNVLYDYSDYFNKEQRDIFDKIGSEAECCKMILFEEDKTGVVKISENICNSKLTIIDSIDLSYMIVADIENIAETGIRIEESRLSVIPKIRDEKIKKTKKDVLLKIEKDKEDKKD